MSTHPCLRVTLLWTSICLHNKPSHTLPLGAVPTWRSGGNCLGFVLDARCSIAECPFLLPQVWCRALGLMCDGRAACVTAVGTFSGTQVVVLVCLSCWNKTPTVASSSRGWKSKVRRQLTQVRRRPCYGGSRLCPRTVGRRPGPGPLSGGISLLPGLISSPGPTSETISLDTWIWGPRRRSGHHLCQ